MNWPDAGLSRKVTMSPDRDTSSWITTASAPSGISAPVKIRMVVPPGIEPAKDRPAAASPATGSVAGRSAARTA